MENVNKRAVENFYVSDNFMKLNFSIEVDSPWKVSKLIPFIDIFLMDKSNNELNILDIGGGSGIILKNLSDYIENVHHRNVKQAAVDLSPGFLEVQKKNNPKLVRTFNSSIDAIPLTNKEIDIALLIDVLEHVADLETCYKELKRVSKYVLLKVPLEKNLSVWLLDLIMGYRKKRGVGGVGHINFYSYNSLMIEIEKKLGKVVSGAYTDVFSYLLSSERRKSLSVFRVVYCNIARLFYKVSPKMTAMIFNDFAIMLIKCY